VPEGTRLHWSWEVEEHGILKLIGPRRDLHRSPSETGDLVESQMGSWRKARIAMKLRKTGYGCDLVR